MSDGHKRFHKLSFFIFLVSGITNIESYISSEPDYKHMLYGGVWKHVIFNPPELMPDIVQASKYVISFIQKRYPGAFTNNRTVTCLSEIDLWCSDSDEVPLAITDYVTTKNGHEYPISIPLSLGKTYNFQLTFNQNETIIIIHHITITKTLEMGQFYVYAHTFHRTFGALHEKHLSRCTSGCTGEGFPKELIILSNLATNKQLELTPEEKCYIAEAEHFCSLHSLQETHSSAQNRKMETDVPRNTLEHSHSDSIQEQTGQQIDRTELHIMTYNMWNFNTYQQNGDYYQRIDRISKLLKVSSPDIVAFQEVRLETPLGGKLGPCQMDHLISVMPQYQFVYQPAQMQMNSLEQGRTEEGLAIFSKYPIIHHDYLLLFRNQSNSADLNQRICQHAVILIPSFGKVHVFNTHLSLSHEAREVAVKQILQYMSCYDGRLVVFLGDLNAEPKETAVRMLSDNTGLLDTWEHLYPSSDGFTFSCIEDKLSKRIDYIFMKKITDKVSLLKVKVFGDKIRSEAASDHRAVMATFVLKN
uniref:Endonuclease/exonuclease/phosphatase domain-containing protein n=1 Tax=Arion vulgaris TaxID=1028688 RepID=A0A0B7A5J5_9EUPU